MVCLAHVCPSVCSSCKESVRGKGLCQRRSKCKVSLSTLWSHCLSFVQVNETPTPLSRVHMQTRQVTTLSTHSKPMSVPRDSIPFRQCRARFHASTDYLMAILGRLLSVPERACYSNVHVCRFERKTAQTSMEQRPETRQRKGPKVSLKRKSQSFAQNPCRERSRNVAKVRSPLRVFGRNSADVSAGSPPSLGRSYNY